MHKLVIVPLLALLAAGCIRVEQKLTLNADASGKFQVTYTVPEETTQRIRAMLKLADELSEASGGVPATPAEDALTKLVFDPKEPELRTWLEAQAVHGIHIDELDVESRSARREVKMTLSFDNIAEVAKADFFARYGFSLAKTVDGQYMLFTRPATSSALDPTWIADSQDDYIMLAPLLSGFRYALEIMPPGTITKASNPQHQSPYSVQWIFDFDADHLAVANLQRKPMTVVFNAGGMNLPEFRQSMPQDVAEPTSPAATNALATAAAGAP